MDKQLLLRLTWSIFIASFFLSCKKDTSGAESAKLKKMIRYAGPTKLITTVEYDSNNRVIKFNELYEEPSSNGGPILEYTVFNSFTYEGTNDFPTKDIVTGNNKSVDSTLYYYNSQNRLVKADYYYNGQITGRITYEYLSPTSIISIGYRPGPTGIFQPESWDSLIFDSKNRIRQARFFDADGSNIHTYQYDSKKNPLNSLNVFKYVSSLHGWDEKYFYRSPNNIVKHHADVYSVIFGPSTWTTTISYNYNSNSYPTQATVSYTDAYGTTTPFTTTTFEYY